MKMLDREMMPLLRRSMWADDLDFARPGNPENRVIKWGNIGV